MTGPNHRVYYDQQERIIFIEYAPNVTLTEELYSLAVTDLAKLSPTLPHKVYVIVNMQNARLDPLLQQNYAKYYAQVLKYSRGILRYNVSNSLAQITIRSTTVQNHLQQMQSHIYPSREAAIEGVRELERRDATNQTTSQV